MLTQYCQFGTFSHLGCFIFVRRLQKDFEVTEKVKLFKFKETAASHKWTFVSTANPVQNILRKINESIKVIQDQKTLLSVKTKSYYSYCWTVHHFTCGNTFE